MDKLTLFRRIVSDWNVEHVGKRPSMNGRSEGFYIHRQHRPGLFLILAKILKEKNFTRNDLESSSVYKFLKEEYTPPKPQSKNSWHQSIKRDWSNALSEVFYGESIDLIADSDEIMEGSEEPNLEEIIPKENDLEVLPKSKDSKISEQAIIDKETATIFGYTEEEIKGLFGDVKYE